MHSHSLFGIALCPHAFRRLVGLGQARFQKLKKCVKLGQPPPRDGRFVPRRNTFKKASESRQLCVDYLEEIYNTLAEVLPESHGPQTANPLEEKLPRPLRFRKHRGRQPKIATRQHTESSRKALRLLPPGTFSDYLNLLRIRHPQRVISLKLFSQVTMMQLECFCYLTKAYF